jgi:hypothetical protein
MAGTAGYHCSLRVRWAWTRSGGWYHRAIPSRAMPAWLRLPHGLPLHKPWRAVRQSGPRQSSAISARGLLSTACGRLFGASRDMNSSGSWARTTWRNFTGGGAGATLHGPCRLPSWRVRAMMAQPLRAPRWPGSGNSGGLLPVLSGRMNGAFRRWCSCVSIQTGARPRRFARPIRNGPQNWRASTFVTALPGGLSLQVRREVGPGNRLSSRRFATTVVNGPPRHHLTAS